MTDELRIRPGTLVSLHTKVQGGVEYHRVDLDDHLEGSREVKRWETTKVVEDVEEFTVANEVRKQARNLVASGCQWTPFGLICLEGQEEELDRRAAEARRILNEFNATARHSRVSMSLMRGRIARDDHEAIIAIREEIGHLLEQLEQSQRSGDVKSIRDLCRQAQTMGRLLEENTAPHGRLGQAVTSARQLARKIVRDVEKGGERLEEVLKQANLAPVSAARFAFLGKRVAQPQPTEPTEEAPEGGATETEERGEPQ